MDSNPFRDHQAAAIRELRSYGDQLLPVLGAGSSIDLGAPTWERLKKRIVDQLLRDRSEKYLSEDAQKIFQNGQKQDDSRYQAIIREQLTAMEGASTLLLRSVASLPLPVFATTNLDHHLEFAFRGSSRVLLPTRVGTWEDIQRLEALPRRITQPILIKMHGTLDKPDTWILTEAEYMRSYQSGEPLGSFLSAGRYRPLFIGFSLRDYEVRKSLFARVAVHANSFAILKVANPEEYEELSNTASPIGARLIPVLSYNEIPELLSLIFNREPEIAYVTRTTRGQRRLVSMRAGIVDVQENLALDDEQAERLKSVLENALDCLPDRNLENPRGARLTPKGQYVSDLWGAILKAKTVQVQPLLRLVAKFFVFYPDILFDGFLPGTLEQFKERDNDLLFPLLKTIQEVALALSKEGLLAAAAPSHIHERLISTVSSYALTPKMQDLGFKIRRALIQFLGVTGEHPACRIPPPTVRVELGGRFWQVMIYPLCRFQVGQLSKDVRTENSREDLEARNPLRPFVIEGFNQIVPIIRAMRAHNPERHYTLLTADEWNFLATNGGRTLWPWGDDPPKQWTHAALRFGKKLSDEEVEKRQGEERKENGLFPAGANGNGIHDLVGNVYEIAFANDEVRAALDSIIETRKLDELTAVSDKFRLCGGAWYHSPRVVTDHRTRYPTVGTSGSFRANIGLRLAYADP